ncbi:MAG: alpha/beta fold hydrolase [Lysobacterales bacterium]|nr:MAG: alpha/beta fold hydrolase [Xanthomonadales bacterium]
MLDCLSAPLRRERPCPRPSVAAEFDILCRKTRRDTWMVASCNGGATYPGRTTMAKATLHFTRFGTGPTLVLLHGFLGGTGYWRMQQSALHHMFDVIAVDLPGFGGSANIPAPDTLSGYAAAVFDLMDALEIPRFSLLGFSMGGMIAQQAVLDRPQRIAKLVLYGSSSTGELPHRFESWSESAKRMKSEGVETTADRTVATWFVDRQADPYYSLCREACRGANEDACQIVMQAIQDWIARDRLSEMKLPTLVIVGDKDRSTRVSDSLPLWEGIPDAQLCVLPNCAHGAHMQKPALFNAIIADFLR